MSTRRFLLTKDKGKLFFGREVESTALSGTASWIFILVAVQAKPRLLERFIPHSINNMI